MSAPLEQLYRADPDRNTLASVGLGFDGNRASFTARLDWGIPAEVDSTEERTWQENGVYFFRALQPFKGVALREVDDSPYWR